MPVQSLSFCVFVSNGYRYWARMCQRCNDIHQEFIRKMAQASARTLSSGVSAALSPVRVENRLTCFLRPTKNVSQIGELNQTLYYFQHSGGRSMCATTAFPIISFSGTEQFIIDCVEITMYN